MERILSQAEKNANQAAGRLTYLKTRLNSWVMKFDVEIPTLDGVARLEIRSAKDDRGWSSYLAFVSGRKLDETCLLLGEAGIPFRFTGATEKKAEEKAKDFLEKKYHVVRTIW